VALLSGAKRTALLLAVALGAVPFVPLAPFAPAAAAEASAEYGVKAAFLYNFTKFVRWPPGADQGDLALCVFGENPFGDGLEKLVHGVLLEGRRLVVRRPADLGALKGCQVLFVSRSERERVREILASVEDAPVLTVSDMDGFLDQGGMIELVVEENKVRFLVRQDVAERHRLEISSKLLSLARPWRSSAGSGGAP
jgi:hypothetical protein